jgi:hypothetical protein
MQWVGNLAIHNNMYKSERDFEKCYCIHYQGFCDWSVVCNHITGEVIKGVTSAMVASCDLDVEVNSRQFLLH